MVSTQLDGIRVMSSKPGMHYFKASALNHWALKLPELDDEFCDGKVNASCVLAIVGMTEFETENWVL